MMAAACFFWLTSFALVWWYRQEAYLSHPSVAMWVEFFTLLWMFGFGVLIGVYAKGHRNK